MEHINIQDTAIEEINTNKAKIEDLANRVQILKNKSNNIKKSYMDALETVITDKNDTTAEAATKQQSNNFHNNFRNHELKDIHDNFLINNTFISHHNKPIIFRKDQQSCLDHFYTNCPSKIKNVTIEREIISDHK